MAKHYQPEQRDVFATLGIDTTPAEDHRTTSGDLEPGLWSSAAV